MSEQTAVIPDKVKSGSELIVKTSAASELFAIIYESPREIFDEKDTEHKSPMWRGDVYEVSHSEDYRKDGIHLKMRRGPDNKPAIYGKYLVKVFKRSTLECISEKIVEVYN